VEDHLLLARSIAAGYVKKGERVEDTEQYSDALLGLWDAVKKYDGSTAFSTYAHHCMSNRIFEGHRNRKSENFENVGGDYFDTLATPTRESKDETSLVRLFLSPHPEDSSLQKRNKKWLGQFFLRGWSWAQIARRNGVSRAATQQAGFEAIFNIRQQYSFLIEQLEN
jgi:RNA polymerase sigma factor (sigma-70 family)